MTTDLGVALSDDLEAFDSDLAARGVRGFWSMLSEYEMFEPRTVELGRLWRYSDYRDLAYRALSAVPIEKADRRNLFFTNPGLPGSGAITSRLLGGVQAINSGESQDVHRHTAAAARVLLDGTGGFTVVEGGKCVLEYGDVVINPSGLWHESGNDGEAPVLWMDVLDLALTKMLHANFFAKDYREPVDGQGGELRKHQTVRGAPDRSAVAFGVAGGVRPSYGQLPVRHGSVQFLYKYQATRRLLDRLRDDQGSPHDGVIVEYYDPATGSPVLRTLDARMQLIRANETTRRMRSTAGTIYCCLEGAGRTVIDGETFEWTAKDIFVVPGWAWRHHQSVDGDAVLCSISDAPALRQLGLLVEDRENESGAAIRTWA